MSNPKFSEVINNPAFDVIEPQRKEMFLALSRELEGKSSAEAISILSDFTRKMPPGSELSAEERFAILQAFLEVMPEKDRERFQNAMKMMESMRR